jgi:hypothetical protein
MVNTSVYILRRYVPVYCLGGWLWLVHIHIILFVNQSKSFTSTNISVHIHTICVPKNSLWSRGFDCYDSPPTNLISTDQRALPASCCHREAGARAWTGLNWARIDKIKLVFLESDESCSLGPSILLSGPPLWPKCPLKQISLPRKRNNHVL